MQSCRTASCFFHHAVVFCFFWLVGCAALEPVTAPTSVRTVTIDPVTDRHDVPAADFNVVGRVSVRNARESFSGGVRWQHTQTQDNLLLLSPLGQAVAEINKNVEVVSLVTAKQEAFYASTVEELTTDILGWQLPLNGLQYWIQGEHYPASVATLELNEDDRIVAIRQDGWLVQYMRYFTDSTDDAVVRPRIIELRFDALKIRMVVDNWL